MKGGKNIYLLCAVLAAFSLAPRVFAGFVDPSVRGTSTATLVTEGEHEGLYLYTVEVQWNLRRRTNNLDLVLDLGLGGATDDHFITFPLRGGHFSRHRDTLLGGSLVSMKGDESSDPDVIQPVVEYGPSGGRGHSIRFGTATIYFYSALVPEYKGPYGDALIVKTRNWSDIYGTLTGAYPSYTVIPEPATIVLLGWGSIVLLWKKRRV
jgi:hypothetical protein